MRLMNRDGSWAEPESECPWHPGQPDSKLCEECSNGNRDFA